MLDKLNYIYPELILALGACTMLMVGVYTKLAATATVLTTRLSSLILLGALIAVFVAPVASEVIFNGLYIYDKFALLTKAIIIFSAAVVLILSFEFTEDKTNKIGFEYPILILLSVLGMLIMVSSHDFLTLYLGLELQSLSLYVLAAIKREDRRASEAAVKYFVLGALASGILLYGISLIYGFTGATNFSAIGEALQNGAHGKVVIVGLILVLIGFSFKISAAPFHMWAPDVYEGVPTPVTTYFAIVPKLAAMALFIRVLVSGPFAAYSADWVQIILAISFFSMVVGAFGAIWQTNIKRLLAYSSIGHMGYAMLGLVAGGEIGVTSILVYFIIYILTSIAIFAFLLSLKTHNDGDEAMIEKISDFSGLAKSSPLAAIMISLLMFSMIGLPFPPFAGFFAKFFIFGALLSKGFYVIATLAMLTSVVAAYYYLRIVKVMYFDKAADNARVELKINPVTLFIIIAVTVLNLIIFIAPDTLLDSCRAAAASLF